MGGIVASAMGLCEYSDVFGAPDTGVHAYKVGNVAVVDTILSGAAAFAYSRAARIPLALAVAIVLAIAMVAHLAFCVPTGLNRMVLGVPPRAPPRAPPPPTTVTVEELG